MWRGLDAYCHLRSVLKRAAHVLPRRLEAAPDEKWACGEQIDKFRGLFSTFASSWTGLAQADKLKGRQCISLKSKLLVQGNPPTPVFFPKT